MLCESLLSHQLSKHLVMTMTNKGSFYHDVIMVCKLPEWFHGGGSIS